MAADRRGRALDLTEAMRAKFDLPNDWIGVAFTELDDEPGTEIYGAVCPLDDQGRVDWRNRKHGTELRGVLTPADIAAWRAGRLKFERPGDD